MTRDDDPVRTGENYTAKEIAQFCRVTVQAVYHWAREGKIPAWQPDPSQGKWCFPREGVLKWLKERGCKLPS